MVRISMGYPERSQEIEVLFSQNDVHPFELLKPVLSLDQVRQLQAAVKTVRVDRAVADYIVRIVQSTREDPRLRLGISPRGSLALYRTSQASALAQGRDYVLPDDVRELAVTVLAHRMVLETKAKYGGIRNESVIQEWLEKIPVPR
jgi:MoxR-like ATPase